MIKNTQKKIDINPKKLAFIELSKKHCLILHTKEKHRKQSHNSPI